jgi:TRAP-type C4-dicarboxylate transport system substrate-binding protein
MKRGISVNLLVSVLVAGLLLLVSMKMAYAETGKVTELRFSIHTAPGSVVHTIATTWGKEVEQKTGGSVKVNVFPSQSLVHIKDIFPATAKGICDIGFASLQMDASRYPLNLITGLGVMNWPSDQAPTQIWSELQNKFPAMTAEFKGARVLWHYITMPMTLHFTKKTVRVPQDIKGLKIEAAGPLASAMKFFGATPMVTSPSEWYMALDRGLEDGICHNWTPIWSLKVHTLLRTHTEVDFGLLGQAIIMNVDKWNSLPSDVQKIIDDLRPWIEKRSVDISTDQAVEVRKLCEGLGHTIITPKPEEMKLWLEAAQPMHDAWIADTEAKGLPGRAVFEETKRLIQKYSH